MRVMKTNVADILFGNGHHGSNKTIIAENLFGNGHHGSNEDQRGRNFALKWSS
ncbi:hypothetical protein [Metabacillus sp. B2-18]|uniref:hypothetical protein n=1 Tax=Metabacillus sp. B2-18 TaxID=2897333 RepID=UPI001E45A726|nr:hypothetical protein [Metabacillus sp. B2-18]UGB31939.1 hypothetical protein LPC09_05535 [Metabacillus sp. B2-18]